MRESFQSPISPYLIGLVVVVILITVLVWSWAVRRPVPFEEGGTSPGNSEGGKVKKLPVVYAAIGASDVVGVGATDPSTESWVNIVHGLMPPGTRFVRLGRGGITLREANLVEVPQAVAAQPDVVTMWNCVNDAIRGVPLPEYTNDLREALDALTKGTRAAIVMLNVPDISTLMAGKLGGQQAAMVRGGIEQWNKAIRQTAAEYGDRVRVVDLFMAGDEIGLDNIKLRPEYISPDNFHPSTTGYRRLGEIVWATIESEQLLHG